MLKEMENRLHRRVMSKEIGKFLSYVPRQAPETIGLGSMPVVGLRARQSECCKSAVPWRPHPIASFMMPRFAIRPIP